MSLLLMTVVVTCITNNYFIILLLRYILYIIYDIIIIIPPNYRDHDASCTNGRVLDLYRFSAAIDYYYFFFCFLFPASTKIAMIMHNIAVIYTFIPFISLTRCASIYIVQADHKTVDYGMHCVYTLLHR
jgi:hypothetical protein